MIHRSTQRTIKSLVEQLLTQIEKIITPRVIIFDGEFSSVATLAFLTQKNIKFIARKSRSPAIKAHLVSHYSMPDWERFQAWHLVRLTSWRSRVKSMDVDVCPHNVNGTMKTLIKSPEWKITPQYAESLYAKRFNIETGYRTKHHFHAFTCTKSLSTRLLLFFVAAFLWNCWQAFLI
ncbi:MAG: hypothetical protein BAJALOKI1v1_2740001, partial [Promethearchaeota archaeon]